MYDVLRGVRVVELATYWFVPAATAVLADWGAEVIKIEHPTQPDPLRALVTGGLALGDFPVNFMVEQANRGKRSIGLDVQAPSGRDVLATMLADADVFVTNLLPGARRRLQIDVDDVRRDNPDLIYVRGSGYGPRGPDADRPAFDASAFWSRSGLAEALQRPTDAPPVPMRPAFGDSTSSLSMTLGIVGALLRRQRHGIASVVDVSLMSTANWVLAPDVLAPQYTDEPMNPVGDRHTTPNPLVCYYRTKDRRWIFLAVMTIDRDWPSLAPRLGRPELANDPRFTDPARRREARDECIAILDEVFAERTLAEWTTALEGFRSPWAAVEHPRDVATDPQVRANDYVVQIDGDAGLFPVVASPVQFDEAPLALTRAPAHGQHTEEILLELGYDWPTIAALKGSQTII
ncbi:MAG: CoA transferase [Ilumatobacteraceae bacterium]